MATSGENSWCFACGPDNPIGLKLKFYEENGVYKTTFTADKRHQGYDGIVHGGIVSTLLDEAMGRYIYSKGLHVVTARLDIRYRKPTPIGEKLLISGKVVSQRRKMYEVSGTICLEDGTVTAEGTAIMMEV